MKTILLTAMMFAFAGVLPAQDTPFKEAPHMNHATGSFAVEITPDPAGATFGRMTLDKRFSGDLEGTSKGEMLSAFGNAEGSGVYVAIERMTGTLNGRKGTFVLHHRGLMTRGKQELTVEVVPDSGTDELKGLSGRMTITITEGNHFYDFAYNLAAE